MGNGKWGLELDLCSNSYQVLAFLERYRIPLHTRLYYPTLIEILHLCQLNYAISISPLTYLIALTLQDLSFRRYGTD